MNSFIFSNKHLIKRKNMQPIIELRDVWKIYQMDKVQVPALKGLNIKIRPQEFVAVNDSFGESCQ